LAFGLMHCHVYPDPAVQASLILTSLDKSASSTDDAHNRKSDSIRITKDAFNSVVNLKLGIAHRTPGFT